MGYNNGVQYMKPVFHSGIPWCQEELLPGQSSGICVVDAAGRSLCSLDAMGIKPQIGNWWVTGVSLQVVINGYK